ncbi:PaaI family thioesterase [Novosphingobium sp. EMRT-2]|uniref:PaaI family thioesterase n=1 Tax=Novosphingobium sp. EMRT-2 TaxID=2571749 RepID=UPI0010BD6F76|nr:PaaI family thioesterase [Novosphingobium sp. EMRT-2]QCI92568.1 PaaI family thioesterase [Novosphingobium sp. EMRT-2]
MAQYQPVMTVPELQSFLRQAFPAEAQARIGVVVEIAPGLTRMHLDPGPESLRPGDLVSGPTQMALVDVAAYAVLLAHIGPQAMAVTSNLNIAFLRGARRARVIADARLLKLGRRLATIDVRLWQNDPDDPVAQATVTYALPG